MKLLYYVLLFANAAFFGYDISTGSYFLAMINALAVILMIRSLK